MAEDHTITNVYCTYVENNLHQYASNDITLVWANNTVGRKEPTGWHVIPNILWSHVCTPKQWAELCIKYEAYHVKGISATLFNPVPITTNIAIQRTNLFAAFNNCTYMWGYEDTHYETAYHPWCDEPENKRLNLAFKEGLFFKGNMGAMGSASDTNNPDYGQSGGNYTWSRYMWPLYEWRRPDHRTPYDSVWGQGAKGSGVFDVYAGSENAQGKIPMPGGIFWDPLNEPDSIKELRAGKNSMTFNWTCAPCDEGKFYNLDQLACWVPWTPAGPYCGGTRPGTWKYVYTEDPDQLVTRGLAQANNNPPQNDSVPDFHDYTVPDFSNIPVVPNVWFWQEMKASIAESQNYQNNSFNPVLKIDKYFPGTEWEQYKWPPHQWFTKGIPLFDAGDALIRTTTQVSCKISIHLACKPRRSAIYCPTWGPFACKQLYRHNLSSQIYQPNMIRYRSGGARRTWQNINRFTNDTASLYRHPREDPYVLPKELYPSSSTPLPLSTATYTTAPSKEFSKDLIVSFDRNSDRVVFHKPVIPQRKQRSKSPGRLLDEQMMEDIQQGP